MSTSPAKSRIPFPTSFDAAGAPLGSYYAQALANNALHQADQYAQVRVNYAPPATPSTFYVKDWLEPEMTAANVWLPIVRFGPFPTTVAGAGAYKLRVRIAGKLTSGGSGQLGVVWSAPSRSASDMEAAGANTTTMSLTGTTSAWKTGAVELLELSADQLADATMTVSTPIDLGGDPGSVEVAMLAISVYGKSTLTHVIPQITALYCAELAL